MRCAEENTVLARLQITAQQTIGNRGMRLGNIAFRGQIAHGFAGFVITYRTGTQILQRPAFARKQRLNTRPVVRLADIHGIG